VWIIRLQAQDVKYLSRHVPELVHLLQILRDKNEESDNAFTDWLILVLGSIAIRIAIARLEHIYLADSSTKLQAGKAFEMAIWARRVRSSFRGETCRKY